MSDRRNRAFRSPSGRGRRRSGSSGWDRRLFVAAVIVAVGAMAWAGIRLASGDGRRSTVTVDDPRVSHVHGLGVNPADGTLYVSTHHGTFRLGPARTAKRVGDTYQDTMGFTVAGPDRFLGSGHPDSEGFRRGLPPGSVSSKPPTPAPPGDRCRSPARSTSMASPSSMDASTDGNAGSGRFMVSSDSRTWETRSALPLAGFAVVPGEETHIVGAGPDGLVESRDGGRNWAPEPGPPLVVLSWHAAPGLIGATGDGAVHRSSDAGGRWSVAGRLPGSPEGLLATAEAWYAAAADEGGTTGIYRSSEAGRNWELFYRDA